MTMRQIILAVVLSCGILVWGSYSILRVGLKEEICYVVLEKKEINSIRNTGKHSSETYPAFYLI